MYLYVKDGVTLEYPYTIESYRLANPLVSLPQEPTEAQLNEVGIFSVTELNGAITCDHATQRLSLGLPELVSGAWAVSWGIVEMCEEEKSQTASTKAIQVRGDRQTLLSESDWTQLPDCQVDKSAWVEYRQSLRDIPDQPGFPWQIVWPVQPL